MTPIHEDIMQRPVDADPGHGPKRACQEVSERLFGQLARALHELAVPHLAESRDMALHRDVVRRVGHHQSCAIAVHQTDIAVLLQRIAAQQAMGTQQPQIARARDRRARLGQRRLVFGNLAFGIEDQRDLADLEAAALDVDLKRGELAQFEREQAAVPSGQFGEPVIREDIGALLRVVEPVDAQGRDRFEADQTGGGQPAMAREHLVVGIDQHRICEPEAAQALADLADLLGRMRPCVARRRDQRVDPAELGGRKGKRDR